MPGRVAAVSEVWTAVILVGAATIAIKAVGPVAVGGRELPPRLMGLVELLAPAVLAALVVTQTVGGDREIVLDERLAGVLAAMAALQRRAPLLAVVALAAATTALVRLVT
jgi:branched-subunit amino acid transport protein